ncbi:prevent host death protein [Geomicrobium sp. JCM 19037]|uniref:AbrB/MazE/SpoVT family DNA-binding domain-containing protein n=1 Tax=unclassified Geomicrobium TaxID=2628951 RepID=UPI00045F3996|nr:hypothetical protein [Geomicrobium sp. JCM 19037]GAK02080.1 prevent host death protein [Geomicrobium sp. JCM 19037]
MENQGNERDDSVQGRKKSMTTKMHPYGGSHALTVPAYVKKALNIDESTELEIELKDGGFFVKPIKKQESNVDQEFLDFLKQSDDTYGEATRRLVDR